MSLESFVAYLSFEKNYSKHTVTAYEKDISLFREFAKNEFERSEVKSVSYPEIRSWIISLVDSGKSNRTVNRKISSLNSYFKFLQRTEQLHENPLAKHKALKVSSKVQVPFSEKEILEVLQSFDNDGFEAVRDKSIVELLYSTGIRREELIGLKESAVDFYSKTIKVLGKRDKERFLPLLGTVVKTLEMYLEEKKKLGLKNEALFVTIKGNKIYGTLVYRIINTYFSRVSNKVKKSPHIIRHSFATHLLNEGADLNSVKELLGHSSLASTQVYTHTSLDHLKQVYNQAHPRSKKNDSV
jgi:integrase/recombinase XerC